MHETAPELRQRTGTAAGEARTDTPSLAVGRGRGPATLAQRIAPDGWMRGVGGPMAVALVVGLVLSLLDALGTGMLPVVRRTVYWIEVMEAGTLVALTVRPVVSWTGWFATNVWAEGLVVALTITTLAAPVVWLISAAQFGRALRGGELEAFIAPVGLLSLVTTGLNYMLQRPARVTHALVPDTGGGGPAVPVPRPRFDARLPVHLKGAEIFAVAAEDHYLRVVTDRGEALILSRLADAVAELEGVEGAQTHRSWWVARDAILDARRGEGRATLTLKGGIEAPVSRTYARSLREAGWFG